jgi:hypothetical protein
MEIKLLNLFLKACLSFLDSKRKKIAQNVWGLSRSPIIEGLWEEGLQSVGKNTAKNWIQAGYNPKLTKETYGLGQATIDGFAETYGTKEGWNEVGVGMLIGLLTGLEQCQEECDKYLTP